MSAKDKVKNKVQTAKGHVKEATGKAVGDRSLEAEGKGDLRRSGDDPHVSNSGVEGHE